ncbi:unnamed protein product, partial [Prorocentrum cordatum]
WGGDGRREVAWPRVSLGLFCRVGDAAHAADRDVGHQVSHYAGWDGKRFGPQPGVSGEQRWGHRDPGRRHFRVGGLQKGNPGSEEEPEARHAVRRGPADAE